MARADLTVGLSVNIIVNVDWLQVRPNRDNSDHGVLPYEAVHGGNGFTTDWQVPGILPST